jgi:hypothetical protein
MHVIKDSTLVGRLGVERNYSLFHVLASVNQTSTTDFLLEVKLARVVSLIDGSQKTRRLELSGLQKHGMVSCKEIASRIESVLDIWLGLARHAAGEQGIGGR